MVSEHTRKHECEKVQSAGLRERRSGFRDEAVGHDNRDGIMLSVVVPLYNAMPYFKKTVASILGQTCDLHKVEVLIMDDGSTDGGFEFAKQVEACHPGLFCVVRCGRTGGPSVPRNMGIEKARGRYVFFCDADDYFGEESFRRMVHHAEEWESDILVPKLVTTSERPVAEEPFRYGDIVDASIYDDPACDSLSPCKLFRTQLLKEGGIRFREGLNLREDDLFVEEALLTASRISIAADYAYYYVVSRNDGANLHSASPPNFERDFLVFNQLSALLREHADWPQVGESRYLVPRLFRFSWMGCAKSIGLCGDASKREELFCRLREATEPFFSAPSIRLLPSSMRLLLRAMAEGDALFFSQLAADIQVNGDFSFRRYDVLECDVRRSGEHCFWGKQFAGVRYEVEIDEAKIAASSQSLARRALRKMKGLFNG
ncbi:glycosyltransferase family 2 protein [Parvibacter caecicola]|uniref:Glycosyltransferase family 2 protein n=2 Tax=Parvibacter caecicola TaxID=747645 RepID=A0A4T9T914_9ACTN|nr:glycosyltransferase family 2 protein [Parvibacter caecicola]TJW11341.1 glycosyltransferase family 2 protein [Parvibacter caecicola]